MLGLSDKQQEFLVALALWKIQKLLESPFRFRSGCHLRRMTLKSGGEDVEIDVNIQELIKAAGFGKQPITDVFWSHDELYRKDQAKSPKRVEDEGSEENEE